MYHVHPCYIPRSSSNGQVKITCDQKRIQIIYGVLGGTNALTLPFTNSTVSCPVESPTCTLNITGNVVGECDGKPSCTVYEERLRNNSAATWEGCASLAKVNWMDIGYVCVAEDLEPNDDEANLTPKDHTEANTEEQTPDVSTTTPISTFTFSEDTTIKKEQSANTRPIFTNGGYC